MKFVWFCPSIHQEYPSKVRPDNFLIEKRIKFKLKVDI